MQNKNHSHTPYPINIGNLPPQSVEFEEAVLGAVLLEKEAYSQIEEILEPEDFYTTAHQTIYKAVKQLGRENKPIDMLTVTGQLQKNNQLQEIGGPVYIAELTGKLASAAHIQYHAQVIKQKSVERQALLTIHDSQAKIYQNEDIGDILFTLGKQLETLTETLIGKMRGDHISTSLTAAIDHMYKRVQLARQNIRSGIDTGLRDLNRKTNGWQNSDLIILAARPAMGKTALALKFAKAAAIQNIPVAVFSLEMSDISLANRLILSECNIDPEKFRSGYLTDEEVRELEYAASNLTHLPIYIDDNASVSMDYIRSKSRLLNKQGKCQLIIADYLQLASDDQKNKNTNREQEISRMSRTAKITAKELDVPFILLSQLNRNNESRSDKKPLLSDLRESGAIEQDADMVLFVHRPEYYGIAVADKTGRPETNYGEIIIAKYRNGATGTVKFKHNVGMTKFFDYATQEALPF